jgi:uncharacterized protein YfiM (DUF2279 family)
MKEEKQGLRFKVEGVRLILLFAVLLNLVLRSFGQENKVVQTKLNILSSDSLAKVKQSDTLTQEQKDSIINKALTGKIVDYNFPIPNKKRIRLVTAANIVGYGGTMVGLYSAWYKDYPQSSFHFFNDNNEWLQVDKAGHMYSAYIESKGSMEVWRWAGLPRKQRIWIGGLSGFAYQTVIETLDGFSSEWGWSWGDVAANTLGSALLISQELLWNEQRIDLKFSFHKVNYPEPMLHDRADSLYGKSILSRMLKDYNGQTYWLSANLKSFFPKSNLPAWLNIAVGYGADGMFGAVDNKWKDALGNHYDRNDIDRYRQWYIAPDINLTKIKTKSKFVKTALFFFNSFKFPLPSIGFSKKGVEWNWVHF